MMPARTPQFTEGPLYRAAVAIYGLLAGTACFLLGCVPFVLASTVSRSAVVLVPAGFTIGPSWVALLYTMRHYLADRDFGPVRTFWRGYRLGWRQTALFWVPYLILVFVLAVDVVAGPGGPQRVVLIILGALSLLWASTVLVIISRYDFRTRDVLRLAVWALVRVPRWTVAAAALLVVAGGVSYLITDAALFALSGLFALFTVLNAAGLFARLDAEFTPTSEFNPASGSPERADRSPTAADRGTAAR